MAKEKNQPAVTTPAASTGIASRPPGSAFNEDVDARLTKYMAANPDVVAKCAKVVKEYPDWAVRSLSLQIMFKEEKLARLNERQMPHVNEWVNQHPGMRESLEQKITTKNPIKRAAAFIMEAFKAKGRIDFAQARQSTGTGVSI